MSFDLLDIAVVMIVSCLAQVAGHYFDWTALLGRPLPRLGAYIYGMAAVSIPLATLFVIAGDVRAALALAGTVISAGLVVLGCYALDAHLQLRRQLKETTQREAALRKGILNDEGSAQ